MNSLSLSIEQKVKLFEMCNRLFPEYKWLDGDHFRKGHLDIYKHGTEMCPNWPIYSHSIHWFEFCYTFLFNKLIVEQYGYESDSDAISNGYIMTKYKHPVDYLYSEFLNYKFKQNEQ